MSTRKRKYRNPVVAYLDQSQDSSTLNISERDRANLHVQAYEADVIRGPEAKIAAASLEAPLPGSIQTGGALIQWGSQHHSKFSQRVDDSFGPHINDDNDVVWVDRYDARLLLDALPGIQPEVLEVPDSPSGWTDLPSDNEDVFFFSPEEVEDIRRDKKRRHIEHVREQRLKARRAEDGESSEEEAWGGSDEEPDDIQREFMQRTATHLLSSPNPVQLEARILANHGNDARFAFLRGRWGNAWKIMKGKTRLAKEKENDAKKGKVNTGGLGVLVGYGDSDADSDEAEEDDGEEVAAQPVVSSNVPVAAQPSDAEAAMEARRARAKEWVEKRRSLKGA